MPPPTGKPKVAAGQVPAFFPDTDEQPRVESPYVGPGVERQEIVHRAGTMLDHRWVHKIEGRGRRGVTLHGLYDESQRVFQAGGELSAFVYWKKRLVTVSLEAYRRVAAVADWIEVIDHERNECWRLAMKKFTRHAVKYDAGIGERIGVPMNYWTVIRADGKIKQEEDKT